ncbi:MAG: hypothetical protein LC770_10950, partial [Acidobacteria bacterium]|nr:hypothetical protein [Acidobacteriota bacterium]
MQCSLDYGTLTESEQRQKEQDTNSAFKILTHMENGSHAPSERKDLCYFMSLASFYVFKYFFKY